MGNRTPTSTLSEQAAAEIDVEAPAPVDAVQAPDLDAMRKQAANYLAMVSDRLKLARQAKDELSRTIAVLVEQEAEAKRIVAGLNPTKRSRRSAAAE